ncbi:MAG: hypothetical protein LBL91_06155 [Lachnospiraceae bacterium]|jgi:hypothetical protein|nr:hypothetical protein [Lachnospiraceae bacterium]
MSLREQPYLPLYVQDFLTDEKLNECSAYATGIYIRLMCIMHKSDEYGTILLKQKDKQTDKQTFNFANKIAKQMPYKVEEIESALTELLEEKVLHIDGDKLYQKRMLKDGKLSEIRAIAGKKGYKTKNEKNDFAIAKQTANSSEFAIANLPANSEIEYENEIEYEIDNNTNDKKEKIEKAFIPPTIDEVKDYVKLKNLIVDVYYFYDFFTAGNWIDSNGKKVKSWKQKLITWDKQERDKQKTKEGGQNANNKGNSGKYKDIDFSKFTAKPIEGEIDDSDLI